MAKYMFLQYVDESKAPRPGTPELDQQIEAFAKYLEEVQAAGVFLNGDPCQPSAAGFSVTAHDGQAKTTNARTGKRRRGGRRKTRPRRAAQSRFTRSCT